MVDQQIEMRTEDYRRLSEGTDCLPSLPTQRYKVHQAPSPQPLADSKMGQNMAEKARGCSRRLRVLQRSQNQQLSRLRQVKHSA